ncbi:MAG: Threonylcarbamoyladenosine tRNA methylthiotransferase MtaB [Firmicutes bacterium ADurb.Bin248]|jgi:threonylcarbamoyladenosine tRNA methylthiotransferase MtaB|nr:MAG: Threonylcarbamoyladenosine tRNA methylthiotransferase MtaB [Firmicutes bacterium ADurb.Bin248]HOG02011.1 tRNA (N(6)-L-threonylcarbamoyladenosine(37)-C(2))-methylthiotransferase MtaB [Clostridia bacterium]HPK15618.1 tRNA (N(6)-L-threonylcarbamoyladenosine(37)-C(2))-methylthiotransferase MtaB [Clostridia bacterium]
MRVAFCTLGCKVNQYDTDAMRALFVKAGHEVVDFEQKADVYVVNTCTVTSVGDKKSRQMVSRAHARNPEAAIVVAGCFAQGAPGEAASLPGVAALAGTAERADIVRIAEDALAGVRRTEVRAYRGRAAFEELDVSREGRTRAYLKIQDGCDRYCAYCIIPYVRGPVRSRTLEDVRRQLELLEAEGYKEIVLTGIHLMSYGKDLSGAALLDAVAQADGLPGIRRIRLGSLEPQMFSEEFVRALADDPRACRQFHLSLQSGSAGVLARMGRRYGPQEYAACVRMLREAMPESAVTTDVIVGFPGETDAEFEETLAFARRVALSRIHVFPFSARKGTRAYDMPDRVGAEVKKERAARLLALGKELEAEFAQGHVGRVEEVLFEERKGAYLLGHTGTYVAARVKTEAALEGEIAKIKIVLARGNALEGEIMY